MANQITASCYDAEEHSTGNLRRYRKRFFITDPRHVSHDQNARTTGKSSLIELEIWGLNVTEYC